MPEIGAIPAVILAGGLGTRLRDAVPDRPKALAPVAGRPFLAWMLERIGDAGVRRAILCTGHLGGQIRDEFGDAFGPVRLEYSQEDRPLGTGGALRAAKAMIGDVPALVLNGDSVCDVDLRAFLAFHKARKSALSMVVVHVPDASRFGTVDLADDDRLLAIVEKAAIARSGWINAGIYCIEPEVIDAIPEGRPVSIERDIFPQWIGRGLSGFRCTGRFIDIGTPESLREAGRFFGPSAKS